MTERRILIITMHGIRTIGSWQKKLDSLVTDAVEEANSSQKEKDITLKVRFLHYQYLYFSIFAFMNPINRRKEVAAFEKIIRAYTASNDYDEIHFVAHSFGTHILAHTLLNIGDGLNGKVSTVILAGSVLPSAFEWDQLLGKQVKRVVNECGNQDLILVLNALLPLGSGLAGRRGFKGMTGDTFRNRFYNFGHSGYFLKRRPEDGAVDEWFMQKYWKDLLVGDAVADHVDERPNTTYGNFKGWLVDQTPGLKWLLPMGVIASVASLAVFFGLQYASAVRSDFNAATFALSRNVVDEIERFRLNGLEERVAEREAEIEMRSKGLLSTFEAFFHEGVEESYRSVHWERARVNLALATRHSVTLAETDVRSVRFRGPDTIEIDYEDDWSEAEQKTINVPNERLDRWTLKPVEGPMWQWSGPHAGTAGPAPSVVPPGGSLQGAVERKITVSLVGDELSTWSLAGGKRLGVWRAGGWGSVPLAEARPCGFAGDALAVDANGKPWLFSLYRESPMALAGTTAPVSELTGNATCSAFAAKSGERELVIWSAPSDFAQRLRAGNSPVESFEFSAASRDLLLVTAEDASLYHLRGESPVKNTGVGEMSMAAFSPTGRYIAAVLGGGRCAINRPPIDPRTPGETVVAFTCPNSIYSSRTLQEKLRFLRDDSELLLSRQLLGSFGDSHLERRSIESQDGMWLVNGSRSDVVQFDAIEDATVMLSVSGDAAGEGVGNDFSGYVWSPYSTSFVYKLDKGFTRGAWLSPDGADAIVYRGVYDNVIGQWKNSLDLVELDPDFALDNISREHAVEGWGFRDPMAEQEFWRILERRPSCERALSIDHWLLPMQVSSPEGPATGGCTMGRSQFLYGTSGGKSVQVRLRPNDGASDYNLRYFDAAKSAAMPIRFSDGSPVPDDIMRAHSDERQKRVFFAHASGMISRVDFDGDLKASVVVPMGGERSVEEMKWHPRAQLLAVGSRDQATDTKTFELWTADGVLAKTVKAADAYPAIGGAFDASGHFWTVVAEEDVPVERAEDAEWEDETMPIRWWYLRDADSNRRIRASCGNDTPVADPYFVPDLRTNETGRFAGLARLGPTMGAAVADTGVTLVDVTEQRCLGTFEHGDEVLDFAVNADGRLLVTRAKNDTYVWHIPTTSIVKTIYGPTRILDDGHGLRVISRTDSKHPAIWAVPQDVDAWLSSESARPIDPPG